MSNNLNIAQMSGSQDNKYVTHNDANAEFDAALTEVYTATFVAGDSNAISVSEGNFTRYSTFVFEDDVVEEAIHNQVTFPSVRRGIFTVVNNTNNVLRVKTSTQGVSDMIRPKPECPAHTTMTCWCDGNNIGMAGIGFISHNFYTHEDMWTGGAIAVSQTIFEYRHPTAWWIYGQSGATGTTYAQRGWFAKGFAPSGGAVSFDVQANSVSIGSIDFADGSSTGVINLQPDSDPAGIAGLSWGEPLEIISPANIYGMESLSVMIVGML